MIRIDEKTLKEIKIILAEIVPGFEIRAFGSRVGSEGRVKQYSDLDLVIMNREPIPALTMAILKDSLTESNIPIKVDILEWTALDEGFKKIIEANWETVQHRDS